MTDLAGLVSTDTRQPIERLRRVALWALADAKGIQYPPDAPKTTMLKLLEVNGVDLSNPEPLPGVDWQAVPVTDEAGNVRQEIYPAPPQHHTADKAINYDAAMKSNQAPPVPEKKQFSFPLDKLLPWQLNHMCKDAGIDPIPKTKDLMIAALEGGSDGENSAERSQ